MPLSIALRNAEDWRGSRVARRYFIQTVIGTRIVTANTQILGLRKRGSTTPDCYISRIRVHVYSTAAGLSVPLGWKRCASVEGGSQIAAADIPDTDTDAALATLEVRTGATVAITGTRANQYILTHPGSPTAAPAAGVGHGYMDDWTARDLSERIRLTGDEGISLENLFATDLQNVYHVLVVWEEVT